MTPLPSARAASELVATAGTEPPETADYRGNALRETYFRDQPTREFVDQVLESASALPKTALQATPARSRMPIVLVALLGVGGIATALLLPRAPTTVATPDFGAIHFDAALAIIPSPALPPSKPDPESVHFAQLATLVLRCTPWCVPIVDGKTRGNDGRSRKLVVAVGTHHIVAQRLDDRIARTAQLKEGETKTLTLDFED